MAATLKKFVKIKPIDGKSATGINFNQIRKGINRQGALMDGLSENFFQQKTILEFQNKYLSTATERQVQVVEEEKKEKKKLFSDFKQRLKRMLGKKKRQKSEDAAEEGAKEGDIEGKKRLEVVKKPIFNFLQSIGKLLGNIIKYFVIYGALSWMEKNPEGIQKIGRLLYAFGKFAWWLGKWAIGSILDGITNLVGSFEDEGAVKRGLRFFLGAFQLIGGIAGLRAVQYLVMPWKMLKDAKRINSVFQQTAETTEELKASKKARFKGYKDKKTGIIYSEKEYKEMQKASKRADARRAKNAGKGYKSDLNQKAFNDRFTGQYDKARKGPFQKMQQRGRIAKVRLGRGMGSMVKKFPGGGAGLFSIVGGGARIASGLAMGEGAGTAVGAGVGQAVGGIAGAAALTAVAPFLGPLAPIIGSAIGGFLGEFVGKSIGPIIEPIFEPIKRYFGMLFKIVKGVFGPILDPIKELFSALFGFIGGLATILMDVGKVLLDFGKFVFGPLFSVIGETVGFVVNNAKRLMDPKSVVGGIADALTFNLFNFDKMAEGGVVKSPLPQMASGGPLNGQVSILREIGKVMLGAIVGAIAAFGPFGGPVLSFLSSDISKASALFGGKSVPGSNRLGSAKPVIPNIPENQKVEDTVEKTVIAKKKLEKVYREDFRKALMNVLYSIVPNKEGKKKSSSGSSSSSSSSSSGSGASSGYSGSGAATYGSDNAKALLNAIADAEGTSGYANDGYNTQYTGTQFSGRKHPREIKGDPSLRSDAAGRYQFLSTTWDSAAGSDADMTPENQDKAALNLVSRRGVNIDDGLKLSEIYRLGGEWASIEGGPDMVKGGAYGSQAKYTAEQFMEMYVKYGGKTEVAQMAKGGHLRGIENDRDIGSIEKEVHTRKRKVERASGGKIKAIYSTGPTGGDNIKHAMGKMHSYGDFAPHHRDPGGEKGYAGPIIGFQKDYNFSNQASGDPWPSSGLDVAIPTPLEGKILYRDPESVAAGYGNTVVIKTAEGMMQFSHLHSLGNFKVGDKVKAGTIMGGQGDTGSPGAWHLHMNAPKALHEKFINYVSMGKATSGGLSGTKSVKGPMSGEGLYGEPPSESSSSSSSGSEEEEVKVKKSPMENLMGAFDQLEKALNMLAGNVDVDLANLSDDKATITSTVDLEQITPTDKVEKNAKSSQEVFKKKAEKMTDEEMSGDIVPIVVTKTIVQPVINNTSGGKAFPVFSKTSPVLTGKQ